LRGAAPRWGATLAGVLALALFFAREALSGRAFFLRDLHLQWFGQVESFVRAVASGSWPVWDPYVSFGQPMLANANVQVLYPLTWLNLLMRPYTYYTFYFTFHLVLAGLGSAALARRWGASDAGAFVAGAAWIASGPFLSLGNLWNHLAGAAWMPWTLLAADHALAGSRRGVAGWALTLAAMVLAGSPDFALLALVPSGALLIQRLDWKRPAAVGNRRAIVAALLAAGLGAGLAAAQLVPSLELIGRSMRPTMSFESRAYWSVHPAALAQALVPLPWDALPWSASVRAAVFESREPYLLSGYLGLPVLLFAACALVTPAVRHRAVLGLSAATCVLLALGTHTVVYSAASALFPPLRAVRFPAKALVPAALCITLLCGFGYDAWRAGAVRLGAALRVAVGVAGGGGLAVLLLCRAWPEAVAALVLAPGAGGVRDALWPAVSAGARLAALGLVALLLALLAGRSPRAGEVTAAVLAGLALVDLGAFHAHLNPTAPVDFFRWRPDALQAVEQSDGRRLFVYDYGVTPDASRKHLGRDTPYPGWAPPSPRDRWRASLGTRAYPVPPVGAAHGIFHSYGRDFLGIEPVPLARLDAALFLNEGTPSFHRLLRIGAVSQVLALHEDGLPALQPVRRWPGPFSEDIRLFRVPDPLPRAFVVGESRIGGIEALLDPSFDPARQVVLSEPHGPPAPSFHGEAHIVEWRADRVRLQSEATAPGLLVLVDTYDPGWRARVDGEEVPVLPANVAFRAVPVPAGRHLVELRYRPRSVALGLALSSLAAVALLAWCRRPGPSARARV
jgi:hypothetical protein